MLGWFRAIMPREDKFFDLFEPAFRHPGEGRRRARPPAARRRDDPAGLPGDRRSRAPGRRHHPRGAAGGAPQLHHAVRPRRHQGSDPVDGRRHRPDDKTAKTVMLFEQTSFEPRMQEMGDGHRRGGAPDRRGDAAARARSAPTRPRLSELAEEIIAARGRADELHDAGPEGAVPAARRSRRRWPSSSAARSTTSWRRWSTASRTSPTRSAAS